MTRQIAKYTGSSDLQVSVFFSFFFVVIDVVFWLLSCIGLQ